MTEFLDHEGGQLSYDVTGEGPLVVLSPGMGDLRQSYRFLAPRLAQAGYRVATADMRGHGDSSLGWPSITRTDVAGDLIALIRHLGGPAVIVGHSISGGAATVAAATRPDLVAGIVEINPFTRKVHYSLGGLLRVRRYRQCVFLLGGTQLFRSLRLFMRYLNLAYPAKPADWEHELARIETKLGEPGRMKALQAMCQANPGDAGAQLPNVTCPVLVIEGDADPDWANPRAEGEKIIADLPTGHGELVVLDGVGHYPHAQVPDQVLDLALPFLAGALARA